MSDKAALKVVLCWHMHQPYYRHAANGQYILPWTYLHAIKDYVDMGRLIEANPKARAVVNFAPILLEQIDDYVFQVKNFLQYGQPISDPLLNALVAPVASMDESQRREIIANCLKANEVRLIKRFPQFKRIAATARHFLHDDQPVEYLSDHFFSDLLVWYHLAWIGETVRRENVTVKSLMDKGKDFDMDDRMVLMRIIGELLEEIIPLYRRLNESGQVELAFSPYAHPIVPLMLDLKSTHDAMPHAELPEAEAYPGGEERSRWHFHHGMHVFEQHFGCKPKGCWPSEGGISDDTVRLAEQFDIEWLASGESVMRNSLGQSPALQQELEGVCLHRAYQLNEYSPYCFFRDDGLSDLIGFTYSTWHADDAVSNLIHHLENIAEACPDKGATIVPIILDGENAWEHYFENGFYFLTALYEALANHSKLELTTFSAFTEKQHETIKLETIVAGSWVYGTFSTWIGEKDKNLGWDLLCDAKRAFDKAVSQKHLHGEQLDKAIKQLAICEGSDWFWWFGDYNPADSVSDFESLYRVHLKELYRLIGEEPPARLDECISHGGGTPEGGGAMRRGKE